MKCGVHVATEMELVEKQAPGWLINPDHADETGEKSNEGGVPKKRFTRKYWKCPQPGCVRVAAFDRSQEKPEQRRCPKCGDASDAPGERIAHGDVRCKKCLSAYMRRKHRMHVAQVVADRRQRLGKSLTQGLQVQTLKPGKFWDGLKPAPTNGEATA